MGDKTIKRCKEVITTEVGIAFTSRGMEGSVIGAGHVKALGVAGKVVCLDLSNASVSACLIIALKCAFVLCVCVGGWYLCFILQ